MTRSLKWATYASTCALGTHLDTPPSYHPISPPPHRLIKPPTHPSTTPPFHRPINLPPHHPATPPFQVCAH